METPQQRRAKILLRNEHKELRRIHGERLLNALALATPIRLNLSDFNVDTHPPFQVAWSGRVDESQGLVLAYVCKEKVERLALCIASRMKKIAGLLGFHDKAYLGLCQISEVDVFGMVNAAELANDSVVFYPSDLSGVILVDCYESNSGDAFTIFVQGDGLVNSMKNCFNDENANH